MSVAKKRKRPAKPRHFRKPKAADAEAAEIQALEEAIRAGQPAAGSNPLLSSDVEPGSYSGVADFAELPLSQHTNSALAKHGFVHLTAIQRASLPHALCGRDILGAAKTGSGKTLCFLIPVVEKLYRLRWRQLDGLGALIISPTRELALQIFEDLRKVGDAHSLSAGLLIGGKSVTEEQQHILRMNILVATPGRLLQHMDETPGFDCARVQALVLDEADRCMDMGFRAAMDAILQNLPAERQTMLFSATQSKRVSDLARLSLADPEYVSAHAEAAAATPARLKQVYVTCPLADKLNLLWFFIKTHLKKRTIVFLATCKQVKFVHEAMRRLRPGVPLGMLHGKMKQGKRLAVFYKFIASDAMTLFATDIAARGLDFPDVDWVVQVDAAEDVDAYIHRVGRTARYQSSGEALAFFAPSEEEGMLAALADKKVPLKRRSFASGKVADITPALTALLAKSEELKVTAQAAFASYVRSVFLHPNKAIFDVSKLDLETFAASLGLPTMPRVRTVHKLQKQAARSAAKAAAGGAAEGHPRGRTDHDRTRGHGDDAAPGPSGSASSDEGEPGGTGGSGGGAASGSDSEQEDVLTIKRPDVLDAHGEETSSEGQAAASVTTAIGGMAKPSKKRKRLRIKADGSASGQKVVFDADGRPTDPLKLLGSAPEAAADHATADDRYAALRARLADRKEEDAATAHAKRQAARQTKKAKARAAEAASGAPAEVQLGAGDSDGGGSGSEDDGDAAPAPQLAGSSGAYRGMLGADGSDSKSVEHALPQAPDSLPLGTLLDLPSQEALAMKVLAARGF